jgi:ribosomal protein S18 acetylase RimI-like enzyme
MNFREITEADTPALFAVRTATHENRLTHEELQVMGITEETIKEKMVGSFKEWLCEVQEQVVGFAIGDKATGELWVIAVLPDYIGQGIGATLLGLVKKWLHTVVADHRY